MTTCVTCGESLEGRRSDARHCSDMCRTGARISERAKHHGAAMTEARAGIADGDLERVAAALDTLDALGPGRGRARLHETK